MSTRTTSSSQKRKLAESVEVNTPALSTDAPGVKRRASTRNKQAVTKTNKASTIAIIKRNAENSPLLSLPGEIREKILRELVGDNVIHVAWLGWVVYSDFEEERTYSEGSSRYPGKFTHCLCQRGINDKQMRDGIDSGKFQVPPGEDPVYYVSPGDGRHDDCFQSSRPKVERSLDLSILGASRQLYEEANLLLWTTNTFSFHNSIHCRRFLESLHVAQKRKIAKLHFITNMSCFEQSCPTKSEAYKWDITIKDHMKFLKNLTTLNLSLQLSWGDTPTGEESLHRFGRFMAYEPGEADTEVSVVRKWWLLYHTRGFLRFRRLPSLKEVNVVISDWSVEDDSLVPYNLAQFHQGRRWTAAEKNAFADEYEAKLLDHDPASVELEQAAMLARHKKMHEQYAERASQELASKVVGFNRYAEEFEENVERILEQDGVDLEKRPKAREVSLEPLRTQLRTHFDEIADQIRCMQLYRDTLEVDHWGNEKGDRGGFKGDLYDVE